jgi:hypothetical protein
MRALSERRCRSGFAIWPFTDVRSTWATVCSPGNSSRTLNACPRAANDPTGEKNEERLFAVRVIAERVQVQVEMTAMFLIRLGAEDCFELSASPVVDGF